MENTEQYIKDEIGKLNSEIFRDYTSISNKMINLEQRLLAELKPKHIPHIVHSMSDTGIKQHDLNEPKEFIVGRWYKHKIENWIVYYTGEYSVRFNENIWKDRICICAFNEWELVTDFTELNKLLDAERIRRGFVNGVKFTSLHNSYTYKVEEVIGIIPHIFYNGKWATIIEKEKTTEEWCALYYSQNSVTLFRFLQANNLIITKK